VFKTTASLLFLNAPSTAGHIGDGTTLHGLRVSHAAWWLRNGANLAWKLRDVTRRTAESVRISAWCMISIWFR
jgi:hypothetical protein